MCGIGGYIRHMGNHALNPEPLLDAMGQAIYHRGPDGGATWYDDHIGLVHRRLSIIDLSEAGTQPMVSHSGRYVMVFNGEIYNYRVLRAELEAQGEVFYSQTDSEVLLTLYEKKGEACLQDLNGMFAFAIWDRHTRQLFMARDRLGKKPLYYFQFGQDFAFGSEIKAMVPLPFLRREIRYDAVKDFFFYQYVPDPKTIYKDIHKLPPGHWMTWSEDKGIRLQRYWQLSFGHQLGLSETQIAEDLYNLIDDAVKIRMVSDVPLGAFLSGGIDSSLVVGMMSQHSDRPVTTCAIGFDSKQHDEVQYARQVAELFGTDHHEFTVNENIAESFEHITSYLDEPFADASYIPTYYVAKLARQKVTVALAGDGGDENFAGYSKYVTDQIENRMRRLIPGPVRTGVLPWLGAMAGTLPSTLGRKSQSLLTTLATDPERSFYTTNSFFRPNLWERLVQGDLKKETAGYDPAELTCKLYRECDAEDHLSKILYTDIHSYLPGDILTKVDRMTMANSLEARAPLLDYRVVELAASMPSRLKLKGQEKKHILKRSAARLLPNDILYRKKMGFSVPMSQWLNGPLSNALESALLVNQDATTSSFNSKAVKRLIDDHKSGHKQHTQELWALLAYQQWQEGSTKATCEPLKHTVTS